MTRSVDASVNEHELHLVPRLACKRSQHEMVHDPKAPPLTPVPMEPLRLSLSSFSLSFLNNIDRIEINKTVVRKGVTYYVLDVYLFHYGSRLPTNVKNPRMAASRLSSISESREPDFRVERRYSDFAKLRHQIKLWTCPDSSFACKYCQDFNHYIRFKLRQPRMFMSFNRNVEKRRGILQDFITDFVELAQHPLKNAMHQCEAYQHVPILLESFLQD